MVVVPQKKPQILEHQDSPSLRLISVAEYHRMAEIGILKADEKLELINGLIIKNMAPQGTPHAGAMRRTDVLFGQLLGKEFYVQKQLPIVLGDFSEPEPDIAVTKSDFLLFEDRHPTAADVYLIIEVADSTLKNDLGIKSLLYAQNKIADYWVLDLKNRQLHVFRKPADTGYQEQFICQDDETIQAIAFPEITIPIAKMFRPKD